MVLPIILLLAFWLSTLLPGYALARSLGLVRSGVFATAARSYALTTALLVPLVSVAYALHLKIASVAIAYLMMVAVGAWIVARHHRRSLRRLRYAYPWLAAVPVVALVLAVLPLGAVMHFDALVHLAKIRQAIDVGFYFQDPYSPLAVPESRHMLAVYHAFFSIGAWLTRSTPHEFWFESAWFQRLLAVGGIEALVNAIYPSRRVGAAVALGVLFFFLAQSTIEYPALPAGYVILPILLADLIRAVERPTLHQHVALALSSLALGAIHVGIWFMSVLCIGIGLSIWFAATADRRFFQRLGAVSLALAAGLPFLLLIIAQPSYFDEQKRDLFPWMARSLDVPLLGTTRILEPQQFLWLPLAASVLVLMAILQPAFRRRNLILVSLLAGSVLVMFVPPGPGILMHFVPHWLVRRAKYVPETIALAGAFGGVIWLLFRNVHARLASAAVAATAFFAGVALNGDDFREWKWASAAESRVVREMDDLHDVLGAIGTGRPMVAAEPTLGLILPAVRELSIMAPPFIHTNPADGEVLDRSRDLNELLNPALPAERRSEIVAKHGIEWVLTRSAPTDQPQVDWTKYGTLVADRKGFALYHLHATAAQ